MKNFRKNTNIDFLGRRMVLLVSLLILGTLSAGISQAGPKTLVWVEAVEGETLAVHGGKTWVLSPGEKLQDFSEILTESYGKAVLRDHFGHVYHLSNGTHVKVMNRMLELRRGYLWVESKEKEGFFIHTANSVAEGKDAEVVISYDHVSGKTQVLVIKGTLVFRNLNFPDMVQKIPSGQFSFIDNEFERGRPRGPTPIGQASYMNVMNLFGREHSESPAWPEAGQEKVAERGAKRSIASAPVETGSVRGPAQARPAGEKSQGQIIFIKEEKEAKKKPLNYESLLKADWEKIQHKRGDWTHRKFSQKSPVKIKIFGSKLFKKNHPVQVSKKGTDSPIVSKGAKRSRSVASVEEHSVGSSKVKWAEADEFDRSLQKEQEKQTRHPSEVNQLIRDLESFDKDFDEQY